MEVSRGVVLLIYIYIYIYIGGGGEAKIIQLRFIIKSKVSRHIYIVLLHIL